MLLASWRGLAEHTECNTDLNQYRGITAVLRTVAMAEFPDQALAKACFEIKSELLIEMASSLHSNVRKT